MRGQFPAVFYPSGLLVTPIQVDRAVEYSGPVPIVCEAAAKIANAKIEPYEVVIDGIEIYGRIKVTNWGPDVDADDGYGFNTKKDPCYFTRTQLPGNVEALVPKLSSSPPRKLPGASPVQQAKLTKDEKSLVNRNAQDAAAKRDSQEQIDIEKARRKHLEKKQDKTFVDTQVMRS